MSTKIENTIPVESEEVFTDLSGNVVKYSTMSDEHDIIKIIEKVADIKNIGRIICGEENSNMLTFEINRYYDNVDLKDKDICIIYKNSLGTFKENAVNIQYSENHLRFSWVLSYNMASVSGNVIACINFLGEDEFGNSYSLKTANFKLSIDNALNITSVIVDDSKNWFVDIENRLKKIENNGGVAGDISYSVITNKPKINGVTLEGNKTLDDLNIQAKGDYANANHTHYELHTHDNKNALDSITNEKIAEWDSKNQKGDDGFSPTANVVKSGDTTTITIIDKNGTTTAVISDGRDGYTPVKGVDYFDGENGKDGSAGQDGISVAHSWDGTVLNITSASGTSSVDLKGDKGDKGEPGTNGSDGSNGDNGKSAYEIAVDNGFVGTETEWLESLKGSDGNKGENGTTPHIDETTKHWFIGDVDTGILAQGANGKDGKSISTITKDDNNNIIVTFTDNSTQNIGKLSVDIQGDFLTSDGIGNLRYYNGHFQYYDESSSTWVDTSVTPSNVYIMNMTPQPMKSIFGVYDVDLCKYKLKFEEPDDTVIDGQVACIVERVIIRRKLGSVPISETDGDLVLEIKRKDFGTYKNEYFVDNTISPSIGDIYYYKAFPMSTTGFYNYSELNETDGTKCKNYNLYGFKLDQNESDPSSMITYLSDCDNKYYESAKMNYTADTFNYGDWGDAWFIKNLKPCMLKYDGTVDYELDKNDYTKKLDGTASDVANASYGGNAMVGIPKVYWKIVDNGDNTANVYFSDKQVDTNFHCWSHIDNNGNEIDYCYMPIYNGSYVDGKLRSISGLAPMTNQTATTEITYAKANNTGSDIIWYTELFNDRMLINLLLLLIGKSTDTQTVFGTGNNDSYVSTSNTGIKNTGTMNTKGLFWGNQDNVSGVKVFGIEHWYGNIWRRIGGWINDKGTQKIKMTYGQSDGSTTDGYNETGSGYISIGGATPSGTNGGYISKMLITDNSLIPTIASGSATTYYCDGLWFDNSQVDYASVGGYFGDASPVGALSSNLADASSSTFWNFGTALSCKPLAST